MNLGLKAPAEKLLGAVSTRGAYVLNDEERKVNFEKIKALRGTWGVDDRWGDYELIFGAAKTQLKLIDLPVHYMERTYGDQNDW